MAVSANQTVTTEEIIYPETDGKPMAESDFQRGPLTYLVEALRLYFQDQPDIYVSGNLLIYFEEGNPRASVAPDVFVVRGVSGHDRRIFKIWEEGKGPDIAIEITSDTTRRKDEVDKPKLYARLGVTEYIQYDPTGDYLQPALRGRRLDENDQYQDMDTAVLPDGVLSLTSDVLGIAFHLDGNQLHVFDPHTATYLPTYAEAASALRQAEARANALEAELAQLRAQLNGEE